MNNSVLIADVVIEKDGLLFVIKRGDPPCKGMYTLPGGGIELNEKSWETVVREVYEETGLIIESKEKDVLGSVDIDVVGLSGNVTFVKGKILGGEIKLLENEIVGYKWMSLKEFIDGHYPYGFSQKAIIEIQNVVSKGMDQMI